MARTEKQSAERSGGVTPEQLREAERGLRLTLRATGFPAPWIAGNVRDALQEANVEYAEWAREHGPARNPVGWLIERGRLRALDCIAKDNRGSGPPLGPVVHTIEDPGPTPEDAALEHDRHRRIEDALSHLSEKERELLALVYYEGQSIKRAGRLLGWGETNSRYHHRQAMKRLQALVGPREFLSPPLVGLVAQASALRDRGLVGGTVDRVSAALQDLAEIVARALGSARRTAGEVARQAFPLTDSGGAAISGGAGKVAEKCGAAIVAFVCSVAVALPATRGVEALTSQPHQDSGASTRQRAATEAEERLGATPGALPTEPAGGPAPSATAEARAAEQRREVRRQERRRRRQERRKQDARKSRIAQAKRARAAAREREANRREGIEAPAEEVAPGIAEPTPEAVAPEVESGPPPAASPEQAREFGGHL